MLIIIKEWSVFCLFVFFVVLLKKKKMYLEFRVRNKISFKFCFFIRSFGSKGNEYVFGVFCLKFFFNGEYLKVV